MYMTIKVIPCTVIERKLIKLRLLFHRTILGSETMENLIRKTMGITRMYIQNFLYHTMAIEFQFVQKIRTLNGRRLCGEQITENKKIKKFFQFFVIFGFFWCLYR